MQLLSRQWKRWRMMSACGLMAAGLAGCGQAPTAADYVARAGKFQQAGNAKAAVIELKNALQLDANDALARQMLASLYLQTGDAVSAEKEIRKALSLGTAPAQALPLLSLALLAQGKYALLLEESASAAASATAPAKASATAPAAPPPSPELLSRRGEAFLGLQRWSDAEASFRAALAAQPGHAAATTGLGRLAVARHDTAEAERLAQQVVSAHPRDVDAWLFKGDLARAQFKFDAANAAYDQVLALDPQHLPAHLQKAYLAITAHRFDAAKAQLDILRQHYPGNLLVTNMQALLYFTQGNMKAAMEQLQLVLAAAPEYAPALLLAGAAQYQLGAMAQAEQHLGKYLQADPDSAYARKLLASTLLASGRGGDALALLAPLLQDSQDSQLLAIAGKAAMETGQHRQARDSFMRAAALAPGLATLQTSLGMSLLSLGQKDAAVAAMEQALRLDPSSLPAGVVLINTQLALGQPARALAAATALQRAHPASATLQNLAGTALLALRQTAPARAAFERALALQGNYFVALDNLAQLDLHERHPELARQRYSAFLEQNKASVEAMQALAALEQGQGRASASTQWLERAAAVDPDAVKPAMQLAKHYLLVEQRAQALTLARRLRVLKPDDLDVLDLLAFAQLANDNLPDALESYSQLAQRLPESAAAQNRLGHIYLALKNPAAALQAWGKALQLQPDFPDAQLALANLQVAQAQYGPASGVARQLQQRHPGSPVGHALEGDIALAQHKPAAAAAAYARALASSSDSQLMIKLCEALKQAGQPVQAAARLAAWRQQYPHDIASLLYQGEAYVAARDYRAAVLQFELVLKQKPEHAAALNDLAWAYQQLKDPRALATAEKAMRLAAGSPSIQDTLGWILVERGEWQRGLPLLQDAVKQRPEAAATRYHLAVALARAQDRSAARTQLEYLLDKHKEFPQNADARALLRQL